MNHSLDFPLSIAPMMEWTDRHYRFLMRLFTQKTILYSEMVTAEAILRGNRDKLLEKSQDNPVVLQLGGSDPEKIRQAVHYAKEYGYSAVNLNAGCPSDRVSQGSFGACLMADPTLVSDLMLAMWDGSGLPSSIKHRIGINGKESYDDLAHFVATVSEKGKTNHFIVHARIAILGGLSPAENRSIPPLRYDDVIRLKKDFPHLRIEINGGIRDLQTARSLMDQGLDGVMIGRAAYENPMIFFQADSFTDDTSSQKMNASKVDWNRVADSINNYLEEWISQGGKSHHLLRHSLGLFHGVPGGRKFRRFLSENMHKSPNSADLFRNSLVESGLI